MTIAEIHRKSPLTTSEDLLTADVFSAFRYLLADKGIVGFLRSVKGIGEVIPAPESSATANYFFWPLGRTREPDVLLELTVDGMLYHVVVEAKYTSGPSDREIEEIDGEEETVLWGNQLADQMREMMAGTYTVWQKGKRNQTKRLNSPVGNRLLLYLTAHPARPRDTLQAAAKLYPTGASRLFWTSWYQISDYLQRQAATLREFPYRRVVADILTLLELKRFKTFQGMRPLPALSVSAAGGRFWTGPDTPLPSFDGMQEPSLPTGQIGSGSFWKE